MKKQKSISPTQPCSKFKAEITLASYGLVWSNESQKHKWEKNDREDIGKLGAKSDIGFFIGYSTNSCAYRVYHLRIKKIMETMNVTFDELSTMDFEQRSSKPRLQGMTSGHITMYDDYIGGQPSAATRIVPAT
ncbi:hypothetical protein Tco_1474378 [Tanacetum coccineum]